MRTVCICGIMNSNRTVANYEVNSKVVAHWSLCAWEIAHMRGAQQLREVMKRWKVSPLVCWCCVRTLTLSWES
ncbi:MAG: hypothetical protein ACTS6G_02780 [Candidatus Hodgkinia cicadicola]